MSVPSLEPEAPAPIAVTAGPDDAGARADRFLAARLPAFSRARLQALMREGAVSAGGRTLVDPAAKINAGETYVVRAPPAAAPAPRAQDIALAVAFEDDHLIVVDKPAGLVVHPAAGHADGTLVNALIAHCGASLSGVGGVARPGIVHRLDKDTSGLLVVAKHDAAHRALSAQFADHGRTGPLVRSYRALVWGAPPRPKGTVDAPLGRSEKNREKIVVRPDGRTAITHWEVLERFEAAGASLIACRLETGRTHQIRVHMAHIGCPLIGDAVYGASHRTKASKLSEEGRVALSALGRQALHAAELGFAHPVTNETMAFASPLPGELSRLIAALRAQ